MDISTPPRSSHMEKGCEIHLMEAISGMTEGKVMALVPVDEEKEARLKVLDDLAAEAQRLDMGY